MVQLVNNLIQITHTVFFFLVILTGVWTHSFGLTKEVLSHLSHASCLFCSGYFWD
jgi:hypothetical protein